MYAKETPICLLLLSTFQACSVCVTLQILEMHVLPSLSKNVILGNIAKFLNTWKDISCSDQAVLPAAAVQEIKKLEKHVDKGCLSNIPVRCGSECNENLHKCIQKPASKGRSGVLLALAFFSAFLYKWNEQQKLWSKQIKDKVLPPVTARKAELLNCTTGVTKEKFGIGISHTEKDKGFPLPAPSEHCSDSLGEF